MLVTTCVSVISVTVTGLAVTTSVTTRDVDVMMVVVITAPLSVVAETVSVVTTGIVIVTAWVPVTASVGVAGVVGVG